MEPLFQISTKFDISSILWFRDDSSGIEYTSKDKPTLYDEAFDKEKPLLPLFKVCVLNPAQVKAWGNDPLHSKLFIEPNKVFSDFEINLKGLINS